jgi:hypothetical protein
MPTKPNRAKPTASSRRRPSCSRSRNSIPKPGQKWHGSAKGPTGLDGKPASSGSLHAEQHYEYHRHPRPGDVLTVEIKQGKTWEKESKRAGKLLFAERIVEYRDQSGELVVTARSVSVKTERPVDAG